MEFLEDYDDPQLPRPYWEKEMLSAIKNFNYTYGVFIEAKAIILDEYRHWKWLKQWKER